MTKQMAAKMTGMNTKTVAATTRLVLLPLAACCVLGVSVAANALPLGQAATGQAATGQAATGQSTSQPTATTQQAAPAHPASNILSDAQIEANVLKALAGSKSLASQNITTTAVFGKVTLSGTVPNEASRELAEALTARAVGVKSVEDNLVVSDTVVSDTVVSDTSAAAADNGVDPAAGNMAPAPGSPAPGAPAPGDAQGSMAPPEKAEDAANGPWAYPEDTPQPENAPGQPGRRGMRSAPPQAAPQLGPQIPGQKVVIPTGAVLNVRLMQGLDSKHVTRGMAFQGTLLNDVVAANTIALPRGTTVSGVVVQAKHPGFWSGVGSLVLQLNTVSIGAQTDPIVTYMWSAPNARAFVPDEGIVRFRLQRRATVTTVSQEDLARLNDSVPLLHSAPPEDAKGPGDY